MLVKVKGIFPREKNYIAIVGKGIRRQSFLIEQN